MTGPTAPDDESLPLHRRDAACGRGLDEFSSSDVELCPLVLKGDQPMDNSQATTMVFPQRVQESSLSNPAAPSTRWAVVVLFVLLLLSIYLENANHALSPHNPSAIMKDSRLDNTTITSMPMTYNLTVLVPGLGDPLRMPIVKRSLRTIRESFVNSSNTTTYRHRFHCIVYVYNTSLLSEAHEQLDICHVVYNKGMWTSHMKLVPALDNTTHVAIIMDDIDVATHKVNAIHMIDRMSQIGYGAVSAAVVNWTYGAMHPRPSCISHRTDYADILFVIFKHSTWQCWQDNLNLTLNEYGWGYDVTFSDVCNISIGVVDNAVALHSPPVVEHVNKRSYNKGVAVYQQNKWLDHIGQSHPEVKCFGGQYQWVVTRARPTCFQECDAVNEAFSYFTECIPGSACSNRECICLTEPPPTPITASGSPCEAPGWHMHRSNGDGCSNDNDYVQAWLDHQEKGYKMFHATHAACCDQFYRGKNCKKYDIGCVVTRSFNRSETNAKDSGS